MSVYRPSPSLCIAPFPLESVVVQSRASRDLVGGQHKAGVPPDGVRHIRHKRSTTENIIKRVSRRRRNPHLRPPRPRQGGGGDGRGGGGGGQRLFGPRVRTRRPVPRLPHRSPSLTGVVPGASWYQTGARGAPPQDACGWRGGRGVRPPRRIAWYVCVEAIQIYLLSMFLSGDSVRTYTSTLHLSTNIHITSL